MCKFQVDLELNYTKFPRRILYFLNHKRCVKIFKYLRYRKDLKKYCFKMFAVFYQITMHGIFYQKFRVVFLNLGCEKYMLIVNCIREYSGGSYKLDGCFDRIPYLNDTKFFFLVADQSFNQNSYYSYGKFFRQTTNQRLYKSNFLFDK